MRDFYSASFCRVTAETHTQIVESGNACHIEVMIRGRFSRNEASPIWLSRTIRGVVIRCCLADPVAESRRRSYMVAGEVQLKRPGVADWGPLGLLNSNTIQMLRELAQGRTIAELAEIHGFTSLDVEKRLVDAALELGCSSVKSLQVHAYERGLHLFANQQWAQFMASRE